MKKILKALFIVYLLSLFYKGFIADTPEDTRRVREAAHIAVMIDNGQLNAEDYEKR